MTEDLRIRVQLEPESIEWDDVLDCLVSRYKINEKEARRKIKTFIRKVSRLADLSWFKSSFLEEDDEKIAACMAGHYSADVMALKRNSVIVPGVCVISQVIEIQPWPAVSAERVSEKPSEEVTHIKRTRGIQSATLVVKLFGKEIAVRRLRDAVSLHFCFSLFGVIFYALLAGLLLYGTAVLLLLVEEPEVMTIAITRNVELFLGLLSLLVFLAAIWGRAVSNLIAFSREKMASFLETSRK